MAGDHPGSACLVLDQGGSSSRALVFDQRGQVLSSAQQAVDTQRPQPGRVEQDPAAVVASLRDVAARAVRALDPPQRQRLTVAGLVCQRSSLLAWEPASGTTLTPILSWQDTRASAWLTAQGLDNERLQRLTGLWPNAHFGASKMRWCLDQLPAVAQSRSAVLAPLACYLAYALLTERPLLVDPANASRTLLMDLATREWSPELLQLFGIERTRLPQIVPSDAEFGTLQVAGLALPLRLLNGDQSAAAFADGEPRPDCVYLNLGTGAFIYRPLARPQQLGRQLCSVIFASGQHALYAAEGTVNGAGAALQWLAQQPGGNAAVPEQATRLTPAAFRHAQAGLPYFLNGVGGLGSPDWQAGFGSRFVGEGDPLQRALAVLESIAFLLRRNFDALVEAAAPPRQLVVSGGLSGSDALCQLLADLTQVELARVEEREASARGAALLLLGDAHWQHQPRQRFHPGDDPVPQQRYQRWSALLQDALAHLPESG